MNGATPTQADLKKKLTVILFNDTACVESSAVVRFAGDYAGHDAKLVTALAHGFPYPSTR